MEYVRFVVRKVGPRWTFGSEKRAFQEFESKATAIARGRAFVAKLDYATLVIEDESKKRFPPRR